MGAKPLLELAVRARGACGTPSQIITARFGGDGPATFAAVFRLALKSKTGQTPAKYWQHIRGLSGLRFNPWGCPGSKVRLGGSHAR
jgi:hypothetical protein